MTLRTRPLISVFALLLAACAHSQAAPLPGEAPEAGAGPLNVIVILADDLGWGDLGANGARLISTPHIDRLGREGMRLTSFYSAANVCTPSRAALLTGRYAMRSGMQHVIHPQSQDGLPGTEITLAEMLKAGGYATHMTGKWHLGHTDAHWPTHHGFDSFFGVAYSNDMRPFDLYKDKSVIQSPADQSRLSALYSQDAAAFIRSNTDQPFFLYYAETAPHLPFFVPQEAAGTSQAGLYGDVVEELDRGVGRILDALDETGLAGRTLVIFTSDNGPWFEGSSGPFRGEKGGTHEGGWRVPMLVRLPGVIPAGSTSDHMAMSIDLLPTIAALTGTSPPRDRVIDGTDIGPVLRGGAPAAPRNLFFFNGNDIVGVRNGRFKMLLFDYYRTMYVGFEQFASLFLFDYEADPETRFSYAREHPGIVADLRAALAAMREELAPMASEPLNPFAPLAEGQVVGPVLSPD
jgi:arylsulfatase A